MQEWDIFFFSETFYYPIKDHNSSSSFIPHFTLLFSLIRYVLMDEATTEKILQIQLDDLRELCVQRNPKGKGVEGRHNNDEDAAIQFQINELERALHVNRIAQSINRTIQDDRVTLNVLEAEERVSADDRRPALQLSGQPIKSTEISNERVNESLSKHNYLNAEDDDSSHHGGSVLSYGDEACGESSSWAAGRKRPPFGSLKSCVACFQESKVIETPCGHHYCRDCVVRLFEDSTVDESLFPTRCCRQPILLSLVRSFLTSDLISKIELKIIEHETPSRMYCAKVGCATFIIPANIEGTTASCSVCQHKTCIKCEAISHEGQCRTNDGTAEVLETARSMGWQRCYNCSFMIELSTGCNHMT